METLGSPLKMESTSIQDIWWQKMKPYSNESLSKMHACDLRIFNYECVGKHLGQEYIFYVHAKST